MDSPRHHAACRVHQVTAAAEQNTKFLYENSPTVACAAGETGQAGRLVQGVQERRGGWEVVECTGAVGAGTVCAAQEAGAAQEVGAAQEAVQEVTQEATQQGVARALLLANDLWNETCIRLLCAASDACKGYTKNDYGDIPHGHPGPEGGGVIHDKCSLANPFRGPIPRTTTSPSPRLPPSLVGLAL